MTLEDRDEDIKTLKQRLILWFNHLHFKIAVRKRGWFVEVVLHERFKSPVRTSIYILTTIGLISAFFAFPVFVAFLFGLGIFLLSKLFEKTVFSYNSMFVHTLPDFEIDNDKWIGSHFGYAEDIRNQMRIRLVGWTMSDPDYARKVHSLLLRWSYGELKDEGNNICTSVIVDGDQEYVFFCYPNLFGHAAADFNKSVEKQRRKTSLTDVHHPLTQFLVFSKRCRITAKSCFPAFRKAYIEGAPFIFSLATEGSGGQPERIPDLDDFILFNLKIKNQNELSRKDVEYDLLRILS
jgi:hypothetical protein